MTNTIYSSPNRAYTGSALEKKAGWLKKTIAETMIVVLPIAGLFGINNYNQSKTNAIFENMKKTSIEYQIQEGDRMWNFARQYAELNNMSIDDAYSYLRKLNPNVDLGNIRPEQKVYLPSTTPKAEY